MVPAPTPYIVDQYSTDSAGYFLGIRVVELLHSFVHPGDVNKYEPTQDYLDGLIGIFVIMSAIGLFLLLILWCFNLFACCQCCRNKFRTCFCTFRRSFNGKLTVIGMFYISGVIAMTAYIGRNEFIHAIHEIGDEVRYIASLFDNLSGETNSILVQGDIYINASGAVHCDDPTINFRFEWTSNAMKNVGRKLERLIDSYGDKLRTIADDIEEEVPERVTIFMGVVSCMIWLNCFLGMIAILTTCKYDDCFVILLTTVTILVLTISVSLGVVASVFLSDFCYQSPENSILDTMTGSKVLISYYFTCNGTSPFEPYFDSIRAYVDDFQGYVDEVETHDINCIEKVINLFTATTEVTLATVTAFENFASCSAINPFFTHLLHGVLCDELIRGLFITFLTRAAGGILLFFSMLLFPCAANTAVLFKDPKHFLSKVSTRTLQLRNESLKIIKRSNQLNKTKSKKSKSDLSFQDVDLDDVIIDEEGAMVLVCGNTRRDSDDGLSFNRNEEDDDDAKRWSQLLTRMSLKMEFEEWLEHRSDNPLNISTQEFYPDKQGSIELTELSCQERANPLVAVFHTPPESDSDNDEVGTL